IGRALNPVLVDGQCEGSVYMALGEALMEEQEFRGARGPRVLGVHRTPSMLEYKSPTTLETPEIRTYLIETNDPEGPYGAKAAGRRSRRLSERGSGRAMMRLPPFRYLAPQSLEEAARLLTEHGPEAAVVAGGTDLFPNMKRRQQTPTVVIGLRRIAELRESRNG